MICIYAEVHKAADRIIRELWEDENGLVSMQVLQEFYVVSTRKIRSPISKASARSIVEKYVPWCVETTPVEIMAAFRIEDEAGLSFWDALILAAARAGRADRLLSEDMKSGRKSRAFE